MSIYPPHSQAREWRLEVLPQFIPASGHIRRFQQMREQLHGIVDQTIDAGIDENGKQVATLESAWKTLFHAYDAIGMSSGATTVRAACELLNLSPDDEIIVPGLASVTTALAVSDAFALNPLTRKRQKGLLPVFVDVHSDTYTLDPARVRAAIRPGITKAIIVVHLHGLIADMRPLLDIAEEHGLIVIEDASQAPGAYYLDPRTGTKRRAGTIGHIGCFSLNGGEHIGALGNAGMLTLTQKMAKRDPDFGDRARDWRDHGRLGLGSSYCHNFWETSERMTEEAAAIIFAQLPKLKEWQARRTQIAQRYDEALAGSTYIPPYNKEAGRHAYDQYVVKCPGQDAREDLICHLREASIQVGEIYAVLPDQIRETSYFSEGLSVARTAQDLLAIPCFPELLPDEVDRIVAVLKRG